MPGHEMMSGVRIPPSYACPFFPRSVPFFAGILNVGCVPAYCGSLFCVSVEPPLSEMNRIARHQRSSRYFPFAKRSITGTPLPSSVA